MKRNRLTWLALSLALAACGGGGALLALVPIVGPIGGSWSLDASPATLDAQFTAGETIDVNPVNANLYPTESRYDVAGNFTSQSGLCRTPDTDIDNDGINDVVTVSGTVDDGQIVLRRTANAADECLRGRFTDVRTIEVDANRRYRNSSVQLDLSSHFWVNGDDATQRFTFTEGAIVGDDTGQIQVLGCRGSGTSKVDIVGAIQGYDNATQTGPLVNLTIGTTPFANGTFRGASEIQFPAGGASPALTLRRTSDPRAGATC